MGVGVPSADLPTQVRGGGAMRRIRKALCERSSRQTSSCGRMRMACSQGSRRLGGPRTEPRQRQHMSCAPYPDTPTKSMLAHKREQLSRCVAQLDPSVGGRSHHRGQLLASDATVPPPTESSPRAFGTSLEPLAGMIGRRTKSARNILFKINLLVGTAGGS
jgi:hypothetical protein